MAKKRRKKSGIKLPKIKFEVKNSVLKEIWGVVYLGLAVMTLFSLQGNFGVIGEIWVGVLNPIVGWGIYLLPVVFLVVSLMMFLAKKISVGVTKIVGACILMVSGLSILHLSVPIENIFEYAKNGEYGGYIGFMIDFLLLEVAQLGRIGAAVVLVVIFTIGVLLTFEVSIFKLLGALKPEIKIVRKGSDSDEVEDYELTEDEEKLVERLAKKIDEMPDSDFSMPKDDQVDAITIKRPVVAVATKNEEVNKVENVKVENKALTKSNDAIDDDNFVWIAPSLDLLAPPVPDVAMDDALLNENAAKIKAKLDQFGIKVSMHEIHVGPTVVQYTLKPHEGVKLSKITGLKNDLALALAATSVRIEAPIPGKSLVGIEVPNDHRSVVHLREMMESKEFLGIRSNLKLPIGRDVAGKPISDDLAAMPHLLIAGATGSGKSVGMNAFLISLLYQNSPEDLRFIMIDPKRVELNTYNGIAHLLTPVITDPEKATIALRWAVAEMNRRYQLCAEHGKRNIFEYNLMCEEIFKDGVEVKSEVEGEGPNLPQKMPNIVIVIDELADLMMTAGKEVEASICRIAQMARAVGMHLIIATQRPSVDVITGLIKANIPARIAFAVSSSVDSRTILDSIGAEDLLGKGDMLYLPSGMSKPIRIQGIYVSSKEIERVVNNIKLNGSPAYLDDILSPKLVAEKVMGIPDSSIGVANSDELDDEALYEMALQVVMESRKASASLLQRRLKIGYARAARLLDVMEERGVIGPVNGAKPREIYV